MKFEEHLISEFVDSITDTTPILKNNIVLINTSDVENGKVINHKYSENKNLKGQFKKRFKKGDILYSEIRPKNRRFAFVDFNAEDYIASTKLMILRNKGNIDNQFLYYMLTSEDLINKLQQQAESRSGTFPQITFDVLKNNIINIPTNEDQKKISNILNIIDSKIAINNQINHNLYNSIETLYISRFKNFEPFKNCRFKETSLGMIPENRTVSDIYSISNIIYGAPFKSNLFNNDGIGFPIIRIRDLKEQEFKTFTVENHPKGYKLQKGDIVVGMDGEFRPYVRGNKEAWLNQRVCVFENLRQKGKAFLYYTLKPLLEFIERTECATTVIHIGKNDFDSFEIVLPDEHTLTEFDKLTNPLINKIINCMEENISLKLMRDTLLPKLMNGEINLDNVTI